MTLLLQILLALGFYYSPDEVSSQLQSNNIDSHVQLAQYIDERHLYHYDADGGVVIEDGVNPDH